MQFAGTDRYYLSPELREIVNIAIAMEKPLLLTGEAGTGKTQLAFEIARALGLNMEEARCKSTFKGEELCYVYDTVLAPERFPVRQRRLPDGTSTTFGIISALAPSAGPSWPKTGASSCWTKLTKPIRTPRTTSWTSWRTGLL